MSADNDDTGSDEIAGVVAQLRQRVPPMDGGALVERARNRRDRRINRRRRNVRLAVAAGAAAVVLIAVLLAVGAGRGDSPTQVASPDDSPDRHAVTVEPSTDLTEGQTVHVTAYDFPVDAGVNFFECVAAEDTSTAAPVSRPEGTPEADRTWWCGDPEGLDQNSIAETFSDGSSQATGRTVARVKLSVTSDTTTFWGRLDSDGRFDVPPTEACEGTDGSGPDDCRLLTPEEIGVPDELIGGSCAGPDALDCVIVATSSPDPGMNPDAEAQPAGSGTYSSAPLEFSDDPWAGAGDDADACPDAADRADLQVLRRTEPDGEEVLADESVEGAAAERLLAELCTISTDAPVLQNAEPTDCALAGPDVPYATVTFTDDGEPVTTVLAGVSGCASWGSQASDGPMIPAVFAYQSQIDAYRAGITRIGETFDYDLSDALRDQPTFPSTASDD